MADTVDKATRSWIMSRIRGQDTAPELAVRRTAHRLGLRFRIHRSDLPGKPDLVFPRHNLVLFVHGCFWHCHRNCKAASMPKSRRSYWRNKLARNVERDKANAAKLRKLGWRVHTVWECQAKDPGRLERMLKRKFALA